MKKIFTILIISAGLFLFIPSMSFALVDGSVYGGYIFNGDVESDSSAEPKGAQYGVKAHYNTSVIPFVELGLGAYYQQSKIKFDVLSTEETYTRKSAGLDVNLLLSLPIVHPYGRFMYAFWDKFEDDKEKFKAYGLGGGLEVTVFPFIRIFGEYMYEKTDHDTYIKTQAVNFGLKFDI